MKADIEDFTFIIPVRLDSVTRLENLIFSVRNLLKEFHTHIIILEASNYQNKFIKKLLNNKNVDYFFNEDKDPIFYRTKYLNVMTRKCQTPFLGIWDSDVIINKKQILDSIERLRDVMISLIRMMGIFMILLKWFGNCIFINHLLKLWKDIYIRCI